MDPMRKRLHDLCSRAGFWVEARYHARRSSRLGVRKGVVNEMSSKRYEGAGIRVLINGAWGFSATSDLTPEGLERALGVAEQMARELGSRKRERIVIPSTARLARGEFLVPGYDELRNMPMERKFELVRKSEERLRGQASNIEAAMASYTEVFEDKIIVTTDGADSHVRLARPELRLVAIGAEGARRTRGADSVGGTGGWECLFINRGAEEMVETAARDAVNLLHAPEAEAGRKRVILSPAMVGLLSHEAIGHTVEADFVASGSVAAGKLGLMVASPLVTLCDSGRSEHRDGAGGMLPVDDEGVLAGRTPIIQAGRLVSYLHNRESAAREGIEPTGNARAWEFTDEPLIRMRNTYIDPGTSNLDEMISGIADGYFVDGPGGGQADATGEFMFGANRVTRIRGGKLAEPVQNLTVSGNAFDVLKSVDAVSRDFWWDLGAGHCGKGQPAKVDAGGPYLRCELIVGGAQK